MTDVEEGRVVDAARQNAALWSVIAELGAATVAHSDDMTPLRTAVRQLAALCDATVDLWVTSTEDRATGLRCLIDGGAGEMDAAEVLVARTAVERQTVAVTGPTQAIGLPLLANGRLQGVLLLREYQPGDALLAWRPALEEFAAVLGMTLRALVLDTIRPPESPARLLTGVAQGPQLLEHLEREIARARRSRRPLSALMVGLDGAEELRQTGGPDAVEGALGALAEMLRRTSRDIDIVGLVEDERFLLLLPGSAGPGAQSAANRHLHHLYRHPTSLPDGTSHYLDVSIGIALFPVDGLTAAELVENAAAALNEARRQGGNRAVAA